MSADAQKVDVLASDMQKRMRRWSDVKLDKELRFAAPANDGSVECEAWLKACLDESTRRAAIVRVGGAE